MNIKKYGPDQRKLLAVIKINTVSTGLPTSRFKFYLGVGGGIYVPNSKLQCPTPPFASSHYLCFMNF